MAWNKKKEPLSHEQAMAYCLRLLRMRNYSEQGMRQKLTQHQTEETIQNNVIARLKELNLINDARFAQNLARSEAIYRKSSSRKISQKLLTKGIDKELIDSSLYTNEESLPNDLERANYHAERFVARMQRHLGDTPEDRLTLKQKLFAHLSQKGFAYTVIKESAKHALQLYRKNV